MGYRSPRLTMALIVATFLSGLAVRFGPLGLPTFATKYGGSMLWALSIYWLTSAFVPLHQLVRAGWFAAVLAMSVEFFKLVRSDGLDAFRRTLPGVLLLGRFFSWWDIAAYGFAIVVGVYLDRAIRGRHGAQVRHGDAT